MKVLNNKPAKSTMQSGRAGIATVGGHRAAGDWLLEYPRQTPRTPEPLNGWVSADDTLNQVKLFFPTAEDAIAFAQKKGWNYDLGAVHERKVKPRNYTDNFRYTPPAEDA